METIDPAMAARVWQRVRGEGSKPSAGAQLQSLMEDAWSDAAAYRQLSRRHRGRRSALFLQLHRQTLQQLQLLKGICALTEQCRPVLKPVAIPREQEEITLRRCYGHTLQRLNWYGTQEGAPEYGPALAQLIRQTQHHTRLLLQLMSRPTPKER